MQERVSVEWQKTVPRSVSYQWHLPWYSLQPHSTQVICTLYRNMSASVLCGDKALHINLQKGQRGMMLSQSLSSCGGGILQTRAFLKRILLFWLSQCSNFCKTLPMYLQMWQCKSAYTGVVYALSDPNSWTVLILGFHLLHKSHACPHESMAKDVQSMP